MFDENDGLYTKVLKDIVTEDISKCIRQMAQEAKVHLEDIEIMVKPFYRFTETGIEHYAELKRKENTEK